LLTKAEEWARDCGFPEIGLHVHGSNLVAINLYHSHGFSINTTIMQKDLSSENLHPKPEKIKFRNYLPDQDHDFVHHLLFLKYQAKALASAVSTEEQIQTGFERCLTTYNFGNPRKEIIVAEDSQGSSLGFLWFYKSKGDLGKRRHTWVHSAQVVDPTHLPYLLSYLEQWTVEQGLDAIRTPVHRIETQTAKMLQAYDYFPANLIMYKTP
jgi:GNAT superfamily N-acetyltransferase